MAAHVGGEELRVLVVPAERARCHASGLNSGGDGVADAHRGERVEAGRGLPCRDPALAGDRIEDLRMRGTSDRSMHETGVRDAIACGTRGVEMREPRFLLVQMTRAHDVRV